MRKVKKNLILTIVMLLSLICNYSFVKAADGANAEVEKVKNSCVRVLVNFYEKKTGQFIGYSAGSGFAIGDGTSVQYIVTNHHVIQPDDLLKLFSSKGIQECTRKMQIVMSRDDYITLEDDAEIDLVATDIAVVKLKKPLNIPPVTFATSDTVKLTQKVYALGFPGAADATNMFSTGAKEDLTINDGTISKIGEIYWKNGVKCYQTNAAINSGNSGGALVDSNGNVIGIVVAVASDSQGIGYAIQVDELLPLLDNRGIKYKRSLNNTTSSVTPPNNDTKEVSSPPVPAPQPTTPPAPVKSNNKMLIYVVVGAAVVLIGIIVLIVVFTKRKKVNSIPISTPIANNNIVNSNQNERTSKKKIPKLYGSSGFFAGSEIVLGAEPIVLGRDPRISQLVFPETSTEIGRKHCIIRYNENLKCFMLEDCSSTNGTFMGNGEKLQPGIGRNLRSGESFYLSSPENLFEVRLE